MSQINPSNALHEIPTSPSRALGCFSSHSAQSTTSISSTHSLQPLTPSVSPQLGRFHSHESGFGPDDPTSSSSSRRVPLPSSSAPHSGASTDKQNEKQYSFIALPGSHVRKRPRRRYDEIERLYECNWPGCTKAYGTLNHLNAHVHMQKHGSKRTPHGKSKFQFNSDAFFPSFDLSFFLLILLIAISV